MNQPTHDEKGGDPSLDTFDRAARLAELERRVAQAPPIAPVSPDTPGPVNLHAHTFYSYNPHGYSPSRFGWLARQRGLSAAGIVDFDVLDGLEEFLDAGRRLNLRSCVSMESRVFVPTFSERVINSPGEPGIAYHMGVGFTRVPEADSEAGQFLAEMRRGAEIRNRDLIARVNGATAPVELDLEEDLRPLTPEGNATERHICEAYVQKAAAHFPDRSALAAYWVDKLGDEAAGIDLPDGPQLQTLLRAKTMKQGGIGYVQPGEDSFPLMAAMNQFTLACGAIPCLTWLNGLSAGEEAIDELMDVAAESGTAAINIIPDRNYTSGVRDRKLAELVSVVDKAEQRGWPVIVGTELNSPGNKFVDDFDSPELQPMVPVFRQGAMIAYAHSMLQRQAGLGYLSAWAAASFKSVTDKNTFYAELGQRCDPSRPDVLAGLDDQASPHQVLAALDDF